MYLSQNKYMIIILYNVTTILVSIVKNDESLCGQGVYKFNQANFQEISRRFQEKF